MSANTSWLQQQNTERDDYKNEGKYRKRITFKSIICSKIVKGWLFLSIFAVSVPVLVYYFVIDQGTYKSNDFHTCSIKETFRVPCGKNNISSAACEEIQCCFEKSTQTCYHYLPSKYSYDIQAGTNEYVAALNTTPYGTDSIKKLAISIVEKDINTVSVILHEKDINVEEHTTNDTKKNYKVKILKDKLMVEIYRTSNNDLLLSTTKGPLIASNNYWEWSFVLTNQSLFGLNQTLIGVNETTKLSKVIYKNRNDHYSLPVFWAYKNEKFHGIVIKHEGPIHIEILPSNMIIVKSLIGRQIELELSVGPKPNLLHSQQLISSHLPPYWALDTYMCRKGDNTNLTEIIQEYGINYQADSDCIHENLLMAIMKDNETNIEELKEIIKQIKEQGQKFLLSVPPHILMNTQILRDKAENLGILYKYNQSVYIGKYLKEDVVYPDYNHSNIQSYMEEFNTFLGKYIDIGNIDGFVLNDNWPQNDNYTISNITFPYLPEELQESMSYTLPWNATSNNESTIHMEAHNMYGSFQIRSLKKYYNTSNSDIFIMSATKGNEEPQPSLIKNIDTSWTNLETYIDNILFNSIVGNHLVSFPVCGDTNIYNSSLQESLCIRWYLVAATMPMFRIGSYKPWRDPTNLNTVFAQKAAERAIERRKLLLPYYYTLLSKHEPVIRPMFYDYYENITTFSLKHQYMIGENILIAHPFSAGKRKLQVYLPSRVGIWYELWGGELYNSTDNPWINIDIVETDFVAFISQGTVLPLMLNNSLNLIIALNCTLSDCRAQGTLLQESYWNFSANQTSISISNIPKENCNYTLENITLYYTTDNYYSKYYILEKDLCIGESDITLEYV